MFTKTFDFDSVVWKWDSTKASWFFVSLPQELSEEIHSGYPKLTGGFGSIPVEVTVRTSTWKTSIFPESKMKNYILPIKASIRKEVNIEEGDTIPLHIVIEF